MSSQCAVDWSLLTKIGRYLLRRPRVAITFPWQKKQTHVDGYTDSDWAVCPKSRKSTSGGAIIVGSHLIKKLESTTTRTRSIIRRGGNLRHGCLLGGVARNPVLRV